MLEYSGNQVNIYLIRSDTQEAEEIWVLHSAHLPQSQAAWELQRFLTQAASAR